MAEWLTASEVMHRAAERGTDISTRQWRLYEAVGLLVVEPEGDRWPLETVDRLIRVAGLRGEAHALPRRVLRLRADFGSFPIPAGKVRDAMVAIVPTIKAAVRQWNRMNEAVQWSAWYSAGRPAESFRATKWVVPRSLWPGALASMEPERFETRLPFIYAMAGTVLPACTEASPYAVSGIALEEQVTILAVRDLITIQQQRRNFEEAGSKLWKH